ncbi:hypothetical protein MPLDJ20_220047 [Mesorhizobium plurifarium]|uniref:Uncharacterized protein n=1 Tax=Mesorhizobium plurifarium TaxID=69974 RepID=A0A090GM02_MESPL|nr:hypothetical protein MPLDJ20_220047 [Mesorhizobium plurifarium]
MLTPTHFGRTTDDRRHNEPAHARGEIPDADLLREMIGFAAERLMELEVGGATGAGHGEKTSLRLAQRFAARLVHLPRLPVRIAVAVAGGRRKTRAKTSTRRSGSGSYRTVPAEQSLQRDQTELLAASPVSKIQTAIIRSGK